MAVKLIATDLDGTLMASDHVTVTDRTINALKMAHDKGVKIAIATGRTLSMTKMVTDQVPFVDYVIYSNGASVYDREKEKNIYTNLIPWNVAEEIIDFLDCRPVFFDVCLDGRSHVQADKEVYLDIDELPKEFLDKLRDVTEICENLKKSVSQKAVEKITLYNWPEEYDSEIKNFLDTVDGIYKTCSLGKNMEITIESADKGNALSGMCNVLGVNPKDVMSFGDADNDITMLEYAHWSFAMGNAKSEEVKRLAKRIAKSNAEDGLALAVEKYVLGL